MVGDKATVDEMTKENENALEPLKAECEHQELGRDQRERQESVVDEHEHQVFDDEQMSLESGIVPVSSALEALTPIIASPEGVSFPYGTETAVEEELEQKRDDYIPITTLDDLPATSKMESDGVECSALCGERSSTIKTSEHAIRTEKVRLVTQISLTYPTLSHSQVSLFSLLTEIQVVWQTRQGVLPPNRSRSL